MLKTPSIRTRVAAAVCLSLVSAAFFYGGYQAGWLGKFSVDAVSAAPVASSESDPQRRVAVLRGEYSAEFLGASGNFDAHAEYWRELARNLKMPCDRISDSQLESDLSPYRLIVLPSAVCLSEKEKNNIRSFLREGKGVICTWATGTRDEKGNWKGWDFLRELTGAESFRAPERQAPWFVAFSSGSPLTAGRAAGSRVQVASPERLQAATLTADGYWSDARLFPVDNKLPSNLQGAALHYQLERGRVVWYGFQENSAVAGGSDKAILDSTLAQGMLWAGQRTCGAVEPWPFLQTAAAVFALDVQDDYENAAYAADRLLKRKSRGTFFCPPGIVSKNPELFRNLQRAGEVAEQADSLTPGFHSPAVASLSHIESSRWRLRWLAGTWVSGFETPQSTFTSQALGALAAGGFRYYLVGKEGDSVLPTVLRVSQSLGFLHRELKLIRLVRMTDDDLHFSPLGTVGLDPQWIVQRILSDYEIVSGLGGLYVLTYHTQGLSAPEYAGVLPQLIDQWRSRATWIATAGDVAEWWAKRSRIVVEISGHDPGGLRLTIECRARDPIEGVAIAVYPPAGFNNAHVVPAGAPAPAPRVVPDPSANRIRLLFGELQPNSTYVYELRLSP